MCASQRGWRTGTIGACHVMAGTQEASRIFRAYLCGEDAGGFGNSRGLQHGGEAGRPISFMDLPTCLPISMRRWATTSQSGEIREMLKWVRRIAGAMICTVLVAVILGPWGLYWLALGKIAGRPSHASQRTFAAEDADALWRQLRAPMPIRVEPLSPHSYLWAVLTYDGRRTLPPGALLASRIALSHNAKNVQLLGGWWHPSGAALTIWLTRNWTTDELVAKGIELERTRKAGGIQKPRSTGGL